MASLSQGYRFSNIGVRQSDYQKINTPHPPYIPRGYTGKTVQSVQFWLVIL